MKVEHIYYSGKFSREYRNLPLRVKKIAEQREKVFRENPFEASLKTHKLKGSLKDFYSFSLSQKYRIIFEFADEGIVGFHSVGEHSIYRLFD